MRRAKARAREHIKTKKPRSDPGFFYASRLHQSRNIDMMQHAELFG